MVSKLLVNAGCCLLLLGAVFAFPESATADDIVVARCTGPSCPLPNGVRCTGNRWDPCPTAGGQKGKCGCGGGATNCSCY